MNRLGAVAIAVAALMAPAPAYGSDGDPEPNHGPAEPVPQITPEEKQEFLRQHPDPKNAGLERMNIPAKRVYEYKGKPGDGRVVFSHGESVQTHLNDRGAVLPVVWGGSGGVCGGWDAHIRVVYAGQGDPKSVLNGANYWAGTINDVANKVSTVFYNEGIRSSNWANVPRLKFLCISPLAVAVNGPTDSRGVATLDTIRNGVRDALLNERRQYQVSTYQPHAKAMIFWDAPAPQCGIDRAGNAVLCGGVSEVRSDNSNGRANANWYNSNAAGQRDTQPLPLVSRCGNNWTEWQTCSYNVWTGGITMAHELGHSLGAVQLGTDEASNPNDPNEDNATYGWNGNDAWHTNVGEDVMYDPTINEHAYCPNMPLDSFPFDCLYNSYFDSDQRVNEFDHGYNGRSEVIYPSGPYLNIASRQNPFFDWYAGIGP